MPEFQASNKCDLSEFRDLITQEEVKTLVKRVLGSNAVLRDHYLQPYSNGKLGYLGSHLRLCVKAQVNDRRIRQENLHFFVKVIPYDVPSQAEYVLMKGVFAQEAAFYREIMPELRKDYNGKPWAPECYLVKKDLLVFEDLGLKGYTMRNKCFDRELVLEGLSALARIHAASLIAEARLGKSLKRMFPYAFQEKAFSPTGKTAKWFEVGIDAAEAIANDLGLQTTFLRLACQRVYDGLRESQTKANVVCHGDLWANNLLYSEDVNPKCLLVDFQLLRYAPIAHDIAQFLYLCTNRSFRQTCERPMLEHYYRVLSDILESSQTSVGVPSWSEIVQGMEEQRLSALITAVIYFPTVLLDEAQAARIMNDPVGYSEYVFRNRTHTTMENMKRDLEYGARIAETVTELVEFSLKLDELPKPC